MLFGFTDKIRPSKFETENDRHDAMKERLDYIEIGIGLAGFGVGFVFLGMLLLFDRGLLAIGNILFLAGLGFVIGLERTFRFFFQPHKWKGSLFFFGGILIVIFGYPLIGMLVEAYGFFVLFSGFFPVAINFLLRVPILGNILMLPGINKVVKWLGGGQSGSMV